jgi:hypothetical protein
MDSSEYHVKQYYMFINITLQGQSLRIERTENLPHSLVPMSVEARPSGPWETA